MCLPKNLSQIPPLFSEFLHYLRSKSALVDFADLIEQPNKTDEHIKVEVDAKLDSFIQDFFRLFNLSILKGEYCTITDIRKLNLELVNNTEAFTTEVKELFVEYFQKEYHLVRHVCDEIEKAIYSFGDLALRFHHKIKNNRKTTLSLNLTKTSVASRPLYNLDYIKRNSTLSVLYFNRTLYELNISASFYDFSMEYENFERILHYLQRGINWIEGTEDKRLLLSDTIKAKCEFLVFKITTRIKVEDPNTDFLTDNLKPYVFENSESFDIWTSHIKNHYEITETKDNALDNIREAKAKIGKDYSALGLKEIHLLVKFYKDCSEQIHTDEFEELAEAVKKKCDNVTDPNKWFLFNEFSYKFALNYVLNNQLSDIIKKDLGDNEEEIHQLYEKICKTQEETDIDNFFPHSKYLGYLLRQITKTINGKNLFKTVDQLDPLLTKAFNVFKRYDKNVYWSQRKYNYIFYLSLEECYINHKDVDEGDLKIFIASSITLPLRKEKYIQEFEENKKRLVNIERSIEVLQIVATEHNELKEKSEKLAREVKTKEIKYIEILSIFAAIIVFAAGSFTTLLNVARGIHFGELRGIILSIGLILFLFVSLVFFISQVPFSKLWEQVMKNGLQKRMLWLLVLLPLLGTIGIAAYYASHHINQTYKEVLAKQEIIINKQDSVISKQSINIAKRDSILAEQERWLNQFENQVQPLNSSEK